MAPLGDAGYVVLGSEAEWAMRADARRNRERILSAARESFVNDGPHVPLETIAARAGVGVATLYRRFPDRQALMRAVALDALTRIVAEIERAMAEEPDAFRALARYMERVLDLRVSAVMPLLAGQISLAGDEVMALRQRSTALVQQMIERAQAEGTLRPDVAFADISLMLIRLGRPLPGPFSGALQDALVQRHLALVLDALWTGGGRYVDRLPGPPLGLDDLRGDSRENTEIPPASE